MAIQIKFDADGLEETLRLLRAVTGSSGPDIKALSAIGQLQEVLALAKRLGEPRNSYDFESHLVPTAGAPKGETWIILKPSEILRRKAVAIGLLGIRAVDGEHVA